MAKPNSHDPSTIAGRAIAHYTFTKWSEEVHRKRHLNKLRVSFPRQIKRAIRREESGGNLTRLLMLTLLESTTRDLKKENAIKILRDAFIQHHPNCATAEKYRNKSESDIDLMEVMEECIALSNPEQARTQTNFEDLAALEGYWLETVKDAAKTTFSVGAFYPHLGGFAYSGTAYDLNGDPSYYWGSRDLMLAQDGQRLIYLYWHSEKATVNEDGYGVIRLRKGPANGGRPNLTMQEGYFVDLRDVDKRGLPKPIVKEVKMERLLPGRRKRGVTLPDLRWDSIDATIKKLRCPR